MRKTAFNLLVLLVLSSFVLSACGGAVPAATEAPAEATEAPAVATEAPLSSTLFIYQR